MPRNVKITKRNNVNASKPAIVKPAPFALLDISESDLADYGMPAAFSTIGDSGGETIGYRAVAFDPALLAESNPTIRASDGVSVFYELGADIGDDPAEITIEPAQPAVAAQPAATSTLNDRAQARRAAAKAVSAFYAGRSMPFKSAHDLKRKAPINFALQRDPSARSAALLAAILTYCDVQADLTFVRGSGRVPGKLIGLSGDDAERTFPAGPESGGLSNLLGSRVEYVSGPLAGPGCENAVFRINYEPARDNLRAFNDKQADGEHLFSAPLALLDMLHTGSDTLQPAD